MDQRRRETLQRLVSNLSREQMQHLLVEVVGVAELESRLSSLLRLQSGSLECRECQDLGWELGIIELDQDIAGIPMEVIR